MRVEDARKRAYGRASKGDGPVGATSGLSFFEARFARTSG
jgi:hypothetical protein